jgi:hypothetical protein
VIGPLVHVDVALEGDHRDPIVAEFERERFRRESLALGDAVVVNLVRFGLYAPDEAA